MTTMTAMMNGFRVNEDVMITRVVRSDVHRIGRSLHLVDRNLASSQTGEGEARIEQEKEGERGESRRGRGRGESRRGGERHREGGRGGRHFRKVLNGDGGSGMDLQSCRRGNLLLQEERERVERAAGGGRGRAAGSGRKQKSARKSRKEGRSTSSNPLVHRLIRLDDRAVRLLDLRVTVTWGTHARQRHTSSLMVEPNQLSTSTPDDMQGMLVVQAGGGVHPDLVVPLASCRGRRKAREVEVGGGIVVGLVVEVEALWLVERLMTRGVPLVTCEAENSGRFSCSKVRLRSSWGDVLRGQLPSPSPSALFLM
eukprot:765981-Hanusia_phi.AAC.2